MEYTLVEDSSPQDLEKEVNDLISEGWLPQGGIAISNSSDVDFTYCQAMIRNNKESIG